MCRLGDSIWTWRHRQGRVQGWPSTLCMGPVSTCSPFRYSCTISWMLESFSLFWDIIDLCVASTHFSSFVPELTLNPLCPLEAPVWRLTFGKGHKLTHMSVQQAQGLFHSHQHLKIVRSPTMIHILEELIAAGPCASRSIPS